MTPPAQQLQKGSGNTLPSTQASQVDRRTFPKGPSWVRECLESHNIFREHEVFDSEEYKGFKQLALAPFLGDRHSTANPSSVKKYKEVHSYYEDLNEASFKTEILKLIAKDEFRIQLEPATESSAAVYGPCDSWNKGLRVQYNQRVNRGHIPHRYDDPQNDQRKVNEALQKEGILTAEPDAVWGFDPKSMPQAPVLPDTRELLLLLPKLNWPFFVIQSKRSDGDYNDALNEASRDGIAIVSAARELCSKAGIDIMKKGPDADTYIYSAVMDTRSMEWYVHWAEVTSDGKVRYHMNVVVESRMLKGSNVLGGLRGPTHDILEWGLSKRKPAVEGWYGAVIKSDEQLLLKKSALPGGASSSSGSPTARKRARIDDGAM